MSPATRNWQPMQYDTDSLRNNAASYRVSAHHMLSDTSMLKVFLIEDSLLLQELLGGILGELDGVECCGCAEGETEALGRLAETPVDLVIIDIELKQGSGIGVLDALQTDSGLYGSPDKVVLAGCARAAGRRRGGRGGGGAGGDEAM